jgi:hypothetical protein
MGQNPKGLTSTKIRVDCLAKEDTGLKQTKNRADTEIKTNQPGLSTLKLKCFSQLGLVKPDTNLIKRCQQQGTTAGKQ